jgi:hypothetical protein
MTPLWPVVAAGVATLAALVLAVAWRLQSGKVAELRREVAALARELAAEKSKPPPEPPPRQVQTRR